MGIKLRRGRKMFHKSPRWIKPVAWIAALAVIAAGTFFIKYWWDHRPEPIEPTSQTEPVTEPTSPTTEPMTTEQPVSLDDAVRAVYLPVSAASRCATAEGIAKLAAKGINTVVVTLKDDRGGLWYQSTTESALKIQTNKNLKFMNEGAVTKEELAAMREAYAAGGVRLIPEVYAFYDTVGSRALTAAGIRLAKDVSQCWYDDDPSLGGRAWLNPYTDAAHQYILDYVAELSEMGFDAVILNGVQFPARTYQAALDTSSPYGEALTDFVTKVREAMEGKTRVILASGGLAVLGINTAVYGDNPMNFGADGILPELYIDRLGENQTFNGTTVSVKADWGATLSLAVAQILGRVELEENMTLTVGLRGYDAAAEQIDASIAAVKSAMGDAYSYYLYDPAGTYGGWLGF